MCPCVKNVWTEWVITKQLISSWHYVTGPCDVTMWRAVGLKWIKVLREGSSLFSDRVRNKPDQIVKVVLRRHCIHNRLGCVCSLFIWLVVIYMFVIFNLHLCVRQQLAVTLMLLTLPSLHQQPAFIGQLCLLPFWKPFRLRDRLLPFTALPSYQTLSLCWLYL